MTEYHRIIESFEVLNVPLAVRVLVREALDSRAWDWFKDCDGCTGVSEMYWPTKYFPPCLRHDFDWQTGHGGWNANVRFYRIQRAYGMSAMQAGTRFLGVTVSWFAWYKWRQQGRDRVVSSTKSTALSATTISSSTGAWHDCGPEPREY
jgi:hypothetical protein